MDLNQQQFFIGFKIVWKFLEVFESSVGEFIFIETKNFAFELMASVPTRESIPELFSEHHEISTILNLFL